MRKCFSFLFLLFVLLTGCTAERMTASQLPLPENFTLPQKKIYALGEATHGSAEFTLLRQNVLEYLVKERGVRAFCLEADFGEGLKINSMLNAPEWNAENTVKQLAFWIYQHQEMADLLNWIREHNSTAPQDEQVRFYGFDCQQIEDSLRFLTDTFALYVPELAETYKPVRWFRVEDRKLFDLTDSVLYGLQDCSSYITEADQLLGYLQDHEETIMANCSQMEYDTMLQTATSVRWSLLLAQSDIEAGISELYHENLSEEEMKILEERLVHASKMRDAFMAEHAAWILRHEQTHYGTEAILVTGHNGHISKTNDSDYDYTNMGKNLEVIFHEGYFAVGTDFAKGSFFAVPQGEGGLRKFEISQELPLSRYFSDKEIPMIFVDLSDGDALFHEPQQMHAIGSMFDTEWTKGSEPYASTVTPSEIYDALFYFQEVHAFSRIR